MPSVLRNIPSVSELLESPPLKSLVNRVSRNVVVSGVRQFLDDMRTQVQSAASTMQVPSAGELAQRIAEWIATAEGPHLTPVINATGQVLPPGLGRAPLAEEAIQAIAAVARGYANVDLDLASGEPIERTKAVESLLVRLTGAESATIVNNSAGAMLVSLAALAAGREALVSRGQLAEIDGGYRLPEIMSASGAILREVGTTNRTRAADYSAAIGPSTAALLRVQASNYTIVGDTEATPLAELVALGRKHALPVIDDIGYGALADLAAYGLGDERVAGESVRAGADLVLFSGDKLLGGPQCGMLVGRRVIIEKIMQHPLARALRASPLILAALAATLRLHQNPELAERMVPVLSLLATPLENLRHRAERLAPQLAACGVAGIEVIAGQTGLSHGRLPHHSLPTVALALTPHSGTAEALAAALRTGTPAVVGRVEAGRLLLDLRSVPPAGDAQLAAALEAQRPPQPEPAEAPQLEPA